MLSRYRLSRLNARKDKTKQISGKQAPVPVYAYVEDELVGEYDSLTKCAESLGMTRAMVKKFIGNGLTLENGFVLKTIKN
jgi:hypothetical protein